MNNSLKTINTLATIISLKNTDNAQVKQLNNDNTKQSNTDNTQLKQLNTDNTQVKQLNNDNTKQLNTTNNEQSNTNTQVKQLNIDNTKVTLPKWLKNLKCVINPLSKDKESFQYSVTLSRHKEIRSNCNRVSKMKPFLQHFNLENINYLSNRISLKKEDYEMLERNNESSYLLVFKLDDEKKELYYHFKSKFIGKRENKIILLLLEDKRYTYVTKPHVLRKYIIN